jgi:hypothetical protein
MVVRDARPTTVNVRFAKPINRHEVDPRDLSRVHEILIERMHCLLEQEGKEKGMSHL